MTNTTILLDKALQLKNQIEYHDDLFFNQNTSEISDSQYDLLKLQLQGLLQDNSELSNALNEISESEGVGVYQIRSELVLVKHHRPFPSLRRTYDFNQFDFYKKLFDHNWYIETKLDGLAIELIYQYGKLKHIVTKGTEEQGENITHNIKMFKYVPDTLPDCLDIPQFDIRCEAHLTYDDIEELKTRLTITKQRNQVSGWLRSQDPTRQARKMITLSAYDVSPEVIDHLGFETGIAIRNWLEGHGFSIPRKLTEKELKEHARNLHEPFDGYILKANLISTRNRLESGTGAPAWAMAFKYNTLFGDTEVVNITWQTNKYQIVPRLEYKEVNIDGSKCRFANLFNAGNVKRLKLAVGDKIRIVMGGDSVPHLSEVISKSDNDYFRVPSHCPCCGGPASKIGPSLVCNNTEGCVDILMTTLKRAVSKEGLNIEGIGPNTLETWVGKGFVKRPIDIYRLDLSQITQREYDLIQNSRKVKLSQFIYALNIDEIGITTAIDISFKVNNIEQFLVFLKDHEQIKAFLPSAKALSLLNVLSDEDNLHHVEVLANALIIRPDTKHTGLIPVAITGAFDSSRSILVELLLKSGVEVVPRIHKGVKCVLVGGRTENQETNTMKVAKKLNIPIIMVTRDTEFSKIVKEIQAL